MNQGSKNHADDDEQARDPLAPLAYEDNYSPISTHVKTYTAGEDRSRLAAAARELGLQNARQPRRQVRKATRHGSFLGQTEQVLHLLLDSATEDARMLSVYSVHAGEEDEEGTQLWGSLPEFHVELEAIPEDGHEVQGGSLTAAVLGIIKGMVGPAILYLPHGFASAGYLVALPIMTLTTILFLYSSGCLLDTWVHEQVKTSPERTQLLRGSRKRQVLSYPELAYRSLGTRGESIVKTGIALMQSGVCLTYLIFVPQNLHASMNQLFGWNVSAQVWLIVMIALQIPLSWIRDIRKLTPTNLLANCLILYGLVTCLGFAVTTSAEGDAGGPFRNVVHHFASLRAFDKDWFLFIGTSVLLFEGSITLLVPLQEAVVGEERRKQFPTVYTRVILGIICFYLFFGLTCWSAFGHDVNVVLTTSLPSSVLSTSVQLAYSIAVIFTFPLQNFPALEITCRTIQSACGKGAGRGSKKSFWLKRNFLSSLLVLLLAVIAVCTMDSLDKVVSLMGSLLGCPIAFVFPPLIHSNLVEDISVRRLWTNRIVAGLGVVGMVLASTTTLMTWK